MAGSGWVVEGANGEGRTLAVSRGMAVVDGFYRTRVIDGVLDHSLAEYVRGRACRRSHRHRD